MCSEQGLRPLIARQTMTRATAARHEWSGSKTWDRKVQRVRNGVKIESLYLTPSAAKACSTIVSLRISWKGSPWAASRESLLPETCRRVVWDMGGLLVRTRLAFSYRDLSQRRPPFVYPLSLLHLRKIRVPFAPGSVLSDDFFLNDPTSDRRL